MNIEESLPQLQGVKTCGQRWEARCPAHADDATRDNGDYNPAVVAANGRAAASSARANGDLYAADLLTRRQVAERLGVSKPTVQELTRIGALPALIFTPRLIRYMPEDVEALIAQAKVG